MHHAHPEPSSIDQALRSLNNSAHGLIAAEAARRLAEYGPNLVEKVDGEPLSLHFAREFTPFFAPVLSRAAALAFSAAHFQPGEGMGRLGVTGPPAGKG